MDIFSCFWSWHCNFWYICCLHLLENVIALDILGPQLYLFHGWPILTAKVSPCGWMFMYNVVLEFWRYVVVGCVSWDPLLNLSYTTSNVVLIDRALREKTACDCEFHLYYITSWGFVLVFLLSVSFLNVFLQTSSFFDNWSSWHLYSLQSQTSLAYSYGKGHKHQWFSWFKFRLRVTYRTWCEDYDSQNKTHL